MARPVLRAQEEKFARKLEAHGIQPTAQRLRLAALLLAAPRHMSVEQILAALKGSGARVSKATVYNTLNLFAQRGLVKTLSIDGLRSWFDSNVDSHYHFHDLDSGDVMDVAVPDVEFARLPPLPAGMEVAGIDLVIRLRRSRARRG